MGCWQTQHGYLCHGRVRSESLQLVPEFEGRSHGGYRSVLRPESCAYNGNTLPPMWKGTSFKELLIKTNVAVFGLSMG